MYCGSVTGVTSHAFGGLANRRRMLLHNTAGAAGRRHLERIKNQSMRIHVKNILQIFILIRFETTDRASGFFEEFAPKIRTRTR